MRNLRFTLTQISLFIVFPVFAEETIQSTLEWRNEEKINHDYLVFLPSDYGEEKEKLWPLIVYLHGGGGTAQIVKNHLRPHLERPFVFLAPICPPAPEGVAEHYKNWDPRMVGAIVKKVVGDYAIDEKRCALLGFSMGGSGAWAMPFYHPELFDRVVVMSGSCHPWKLRHFPKIPVRVYSGEKESWLPQHTNTVRSARSFGVDVTHTIWPGAGHGACRQRTMLDEELWDWISKPL
ncbi:MAG: alpha/beta hydrolase-fold protein [Verrucomicrobiales bacterium]|nr:alpha/beta hydrolase-fold protein [Verrucomicrobiales bacterium]